VPVLSLLFGRIPCVQHKTRKDNRQPPVESRSKFGSQFYNHENGPDLKKLSRATSKEYLHVRALFKPGILWIEERDFDN
jgi:hypothetical protein